MNWLDILVILIMAACILGGMWRGFIRAILGFTSFIIAIFLTNLLYPSLGRFLRGIDGLYASMSTSISRMLNLEGRFEQGIHGTYTQFIENLPLPAAVRDTLLQNYSDQTVAESLNATGVVDYISGFLAGLAINIIAIVVVFVLVLIGLAVLSRSLNLVAKLPVIRTLNKLLGAAVGAVFGLLLTWLVLGIVVVYFSANSATDMQALLEASVIARPINEANFMLHFILRLFP
ncbi:MAG: CvpA family protein [Defluviitaleaceae bacterium]|nr:CvpA family protein [Defluviitaleaceae bacterium]